MDCKRALLSLPRVSENNSFAFIASVSPAGSREVRSDRLFPRAKISAVAGPITSIAANLERVKERIEAAATRSGRRVKDITLVAVSKTFQAEALREAYAAGARHFGENRIQEWESKIGLLADLPVTSHFIGHLQSNKSRRAAHLFDRVDSLDTAGLAQKVNAAASDEGKRLPVLIEVRLGDEPTKNGVHESELLPLAGAIVTLPHLELLGLMTIPPYFDDAQNSRPYFRRLRELRDGVSQALGIPLPVLSMGMSHDFEIAIEEGATEIRIGTDIFGGRDGQD